MGLMAFPSSAKSTKRMHQDPTYLRPETDAYYGNLFGVFYSTRLLVADGEALPLVGNLQYRSGLS